MIKNILFDLDDTILDFHKCERTALSQTFKRIGVNKPDIRFFEKCFSEIDDIKKEETIIIGDSLNSDIQGGINAGIKTCWYNPKKAGYPKSMNIDFVIHSLDEIEEVIQKEQE